MLEQQADIKARLQHLSTAGSMCQPDVAHHFSALRREFWAHAKISYEKGAKRNIDSDVRNFPVWFCRVVGQADV